MNRLITLLLCLILVLMPGCALAGAEAAAPIFTIDEYPIVDGSISALPLSYALMDHFTNCGLEEARSAIRHSATTGAYYQLIDKSADLLLAYEPVQDALDYASSQNVELEMVEIAMDGLAFVVNAENPIGGLSVQQIVDIYTDNIVNWNQIPGGAALPIDPFQRPAASASQVMMKKLVMQGKAMAAPPTHKVPGESLALEEELTGYANQHTAISYCTLYYAQNMYTQSGVKLLSIDDVVPSVETIELGKYPLAAPIYAVIRASEPVDSCARQVFEFLSSPDGQRLIRANGYAGAPGAVG